MHLSEQPVEAATFRSPVRPLSYRLTRFMYLRALGFIYSVAFAILCNQALPLIGSHGLLPATSFMQRVHGAETFWDRPTLFWFDVSDTALRGCAWLGLGLSLAVLLGIDNACVMAALWVLYMSFVHIGQIFYGYGWEFLLLEAGFLGIFLCPLRSVFASRNALPPARPVIWMLWWLLCRLMLGAGLIKIRGDACWRDLTCLAYHYETQPNPHPLSWLLHQAPLGFHELGVLFNHWVELVVPFFLFAPRVLRRIAGAFIVAFQSFLILSGNLSFLNWLTLAVCLATFDDAVWQRVLPRKLVERIAHTRVSAPSAARLSQAVVVCLSVVVCVRSYDPIVNMLSPHQRMNTSFDPLHLVNSYGAFGSIGKVRDEVILEGTHDSLPNPNARWREYAFKCKPGDVNRRPCWITPYHLRLDWQMWFAALSDYSHQPWLLHLIYKLLQNDTGALSLLDGNPFPEGPPKYIRAERYRYQFTHFSDHTPAWWKRERIGAYLPPLSTANPSLRTFLAERGWLKDAQQR